MLATSTCTPPGKGARGQAGSRAVCGPQVGTWKGEHKLSYWAGLAVLGVWQARDSMKM